MEDRHTISEPRIHQGNNELSWEVDIYRNGVEQPIDTVIISNTVLPPRTNKKGKLLWKLPTEPGKLPSFGTDEKVRILELFKEQKKTKKKSKALEMNKTIQNHELVGSEASPSHSSLSPPPSVLHTNSSDIHTTLASLHLQDVSAGSITNTDNTSTSHMTCTNNTISHSSSTTQKTLLTPPPGLVSQTTPHRFITIPQLDILPYPNKANIVAQAFMDMYYPHVRHGWADTLASYYTTHAQKSVSVGAAYNLVMGRQDIALQLASLASMTFLIRGVVAQDIHYRNTLDCQGVHILITGLSIKDSSSSITTYFAHSLNLVSATQTLFIPRFTPGDDTTTTTTTTLPPRNSNSSSSLEHSQSFTQVEQQIPFSFQIQNDSMSFFIHDS